MSQLQLSGFVYLCWSERRRIDSSEDSWELDFLSHVLSAPVRGTLELLGSRVGLVLPVLMRLAFLNAVKNRGQEKPTYIYYNPTLCYISLYVTSMLLPRKSKYYDFFCYFVFLCYCDQLYSHTGKGQSKTWRTNFAEITVNLNIITI